ncbi:unnamed protein product [Brassicogethes aeneus]|uniref:Kinesin-like protein n=1 Tax=Brassicogethes aeneus TaxID=1431903 RepID=A0A9P0AS50_BRAAE|nr:unnamed protein product [Brassicogethes aeneus]
MDRSKLPKPSGLRMPQIRSANNENQPKSNLLKPTQMFLKRKSKSYSDLSTIGNNHKNTFKPTLQPLTSNGINKPSISTTNTKMRRRSKSITDLSKPIVKKPLTRPPVATTSRAPVKRGATDKMPDESKPKVMKQQKVASWDYKGKFNQLNEKYLALQETNKNMKDKLSELSDIEINYEKIQEDIEQLHTVKLELTRCNTDLTAEVKALRESNGKYSLELETLKENHDKLTCSHKKLVEEDKINRETVAHLKHVEEELEQLKIRYETLNNTHGKLKLEYDSNIIDNEYLTRSFNKEKDDNAQLVKEVAQLKNLLQEHNALRRQLHNTIQDLKGNIRVYARVRPPLKNSDEDDKLQCSISYLDESCLEIRKTRESVSVSGKVVDCKAEFKFDKVFAPESTQSDVFEELAQLVQSALDGYNVCVFAYGQTGSGKTFTMQGGNEPELYGMIPRTIDLLYSTIEQLESSGWKYTVHASFLEIYNENIRDLLDHKSTKTCEVRFNEGKGTTVTNLTIQPMENASDLKHYMTISHRNRAVAATDFNTHSSRSHAVTKIYLEGTQQESQAVFQGSINLVDLAGSESAKTSSNDRLVETKNINKSLSTLGSVMLALYNKDNHVPYRNSKLTYLLQSCLGGNSKTLMFVNISPFEECYIESINSLRFAAKVKEVKLGSKRNKTIVAKQV